jgi:hypothetical protein
MNECMNAKVAFSGNLKDTGSEKHNLHKKLSGIRWSLESLHSIKFSFSFCGTGI